MSKTKLFQDEANLKFGTGKPTYVNGRRLKEGERVIVTEITGGFENCKTSEYVSLGYWNGHAFQEVYKAAPAVAGDLVHWTGKLRLREDQYLQAYCPDVADGELMKLRGNGYFE